MGDLLKILFGLCLFWGSSGGTLLIFKLSVYSIPNMDGIWGDQPGDPFFKAFKCTQNGYCAEIYRSEQIQSAYEAIFLPFTTPFTDCNEIFKFEVWDKDELTPDDLIGWFQGSVQDLTSNDCVGLRVARYYPMQVGNNCGATITTWTTP